MKVDNLAAYGLAVVVVLTCVAVANSGVTRTDYVYHQKNDWGRTVEVSKLEFDGRTYHIFVGSDWGKVIDVTPGPVRDRLLLENKK